MNLFTEEIIGNRRNALLEYDKCDCFCHTERNVHHIHGTCYCMKCEGCGENIRGTSFEVHQLRCPGRSEA